MALFLMKNKLNSVYQLTAAAICGVVMMLSFAPFYVFPLAVVAAVGLCALIYHASPKQSFWNGFFFGLGLFGSGVYWVFISISKYGDVPDVIAFFITAALIAFLSLYPGIACFLTNRYFSAHMRSKVIYAFPSIWVFSEWVRSWFMSGFAWLLVGYSQTNSPLKGFAPIFGVYGISLLVMITAGLIVHSYMSMRKHHYFDIYTNLFAVAAIWITGSLLCLIPWTEPAGDPVTVSLVQGNIPQSLKWDPNEIELSFNSYQQMSEPLWGKSDFIIWPESSIPMPLQDAMDFVDSMSEKAKSSNSELIFGIPVQTKDESGYYNALVSVGKYENAYTKRQLVPFGEYVPMENIFHRIFDFMNVPMSNMKPGQMHQEPMRFGSFKIMPSICYEITYPDLSLVKDRSVGMLLTATNDAWYGRSSAQAQHLQMAVMRSIEMARPGLFVSNDGITAIISPQGNIEAEAPDHTSYVLTGKVQPYAGLTPLMNNDIDPLLVIMIVMLFASYRYARKKHAAHNTDNSITVQ
jgi:apolipoprotein N-acyltransferase